MTDAENAGTAWERSMKDDEEKIACKKCRHFHITWNKDFPRGCRVMGFKSRSAPSVLVLKSSGMSCRLFEPVERDSITTR
jgi:hypothetical protein